MSRVGHKFLVKRVSWTGGHEVVAKNIYFKTLYIKNEHRYIDIGVFNLDLTFGTITTSSLSYYKDTGIGLCYGNGKTWSS